MIRMVSCVHGDQCFVELCHQRDEWQFIWHVAEWTFEFTRDLVDAGEACDDGECEERSQPYVERVLVHEQGDDGDDHPHEEDGQLGMDERERNESDLACVVVVDHTVSQKLDDARNDGRTDLAGGSGQMLADAKFGQPLPAQLRLGVRSFGHLQELDFAVGNAADDRQRSCDCVSHALVGRPRHTEESQKDTADCLDARHLQRLVLVGIHFGPRGTGFVKVQRRLDAIRIIPKRRQRNGRCQGCKMSQFLQKQRRRPATCQTGKSLGVEFSGILRIAERCRGSVLEEGAPISVQARRAQQRSRLAVARIGCEVILERFLVRHEAFLSRVLVKDVLFAPVRDGVDGLVDGPDDLRRMVLVALAARGTEFASTRTGTIETPDMTSTTIGLRCRHGGDPWRLEAFG
mmetsp:Transcript_5463/g.16127  ORF Transcript_5463/g.16127 Transcript_5463/m.16127 type:complete len:403 (-) Transcript_5463:457-1665(-)